jgi:coenzyme F420-reducing hydrogenase delta subunit
MHAFVKGFDGVLLLICGEGCCHNLIGNVDLERRANLLKEILNSRGIDDRRMHIISTCSREGNECVEKIGEFCSHLTEITEAAGTVILS